MEDIVMKTEINHTQRHSTANYIFFGITLSIFTLSIYFSLVQNNLDFYTNASVTSILNRQATTASTVTVNELSPIDLKQYFEEVIEEPMVIDNWMSDASWISTTTTIAYINSDFVEETLPVQDWMVLSETWNFPIEQEFAEASIPLESWMLNTSDWSLINSTYFDESAIVEASIPLESWMLSTDSWLTTFNEEYVEVAIPLEDWMLSTSSWQIVEVLNSNYEEKDIALESWMLNINSWENLSNSYANQ